MDKQEIVPVLINTSFNVRGEPIICTPTDAFKCFMGTEMDVLAVGNYVLYKEQQDEELKENYNHDPNVDVNKICRVDYVLKGTTKYSQVIPKKFELNGEKPM